MNDFAADLAGRTLVVEHAADLRLEDGALNITSKLCAKIPVSEIKRLIICSESATLSSGVINAVTANGGVIIMCDRKHLPVSQVVGIPDHSSAAGNFMAQAAWTPERKAAVWQNIAARKIYNQSLLLKDLGISAWESIENYSKRVEPGDAGNMESVAAGVYFRALFGSGFIRHTDSKINSALNYGYVILCSEFTRLITAHGYSTCLGINHRSVANRFNLSCDLMEPFRPAVDMTVYENRHCEFDWDFKKKLIGVLKYPFRYNGGSYSLSDAANAYTLDILAAMKNESRKIGEVGPWHSIVR